MSLDRSTVGLFWCVVFVVLDAAQAVYLGALLQTLDSFLLGGAVFGVCTVGCLGWVALRRPAQLVLAWNCRPTVLFLNATVAVGWSLYFLAVQTIEPAVAFTLFVGAIPLTTAAAGLLGVREGEVPRNGLEWLGNGTIALALVFLLLASVTGLTGFVRGAATGAVLGCALAFGGGIAIAGMLLCGQRLHRAGLDPITQFGLRFPLYLLVCVGGVAGGLDAKGPVDLGDFAVAFAFGLLLLAFPIYAVQKAISLVSSMTLAAIAATAPLLIFLLQMAEGRVAVAPVTAAGLVVFFAGSLIGLAGTARALSRRPVPPSTRDSDAV